jgi:hypothetical protein
MAKTGKPYELLTQSIFQDLVDQSSSASTIGVQHNVTLQGRTTSHQIDVYWKFELAGIVYQTVVQVKDWRRRVDQLHLLAFRTVLDDLPGRPRGIFVTRSGYQRGAKTFADSHDILLYEISEDVPAPIQTVVGGFARLALKIEPSSTPGHKVAVLEGAVFTPRIDDLKFLVDPEWLQRQRQEDPSCLEALDTEVKRLAGSMKLNAIGLHDSHGDLVCTVADFTWIWCNEMRQGHEMSAGKSKQFGKVLYLTVPKAGRIPLFGLSARITFEEAPIRRLMRREDMAQYIVRNLTEGRVDVAVRPRS